MLSSTPASSLAQTRITSVRLLRREFSQWRAAIDAHVLVSVTDRAGRILEVNDLFCRVSGFDREELIGSNHQVMNSGAHSHEFMRELRGTIGAGRTWRGAWCACPAPNPFI